MDRHGDNYRVIAGERDIEDDDLAPAKEQLPVYIRNNHR